MNDQDSGAMEPTTDLETGLVKEGVSSPLEAVPVPLSAVAQAVDLSEAKDHGAYKEPRHEFGPVPKKKIGRPTKAEQAERHNKAKAEMIAKIEQLKDPRFFIETFFWILDKDTRKKIPFLFKPAQEKFYNHRSNNDLVLKSRKEGFSSLIEAEFLHACITQQNTNAVTMSHTMDDTKIHMDRIRYFIDTMGSKDTQVKVTLDKDNQRELYFPDTNSYYWIGTAGSRTFGRGRDITHLHLSEVAHYENQEVLTSVFEACTSTARKVLETTANGIGETFSELWTQAGDPKSGSEWRQHFFAWYEEPSYVKEIPWQNNPVWTDGDKKLMKDFNLTEEQMYWYRCKRNNSADRQKFVQEYPFTPEEAFISSGRHIFQIDRLKAMKLSASEVMFQGNLVGDVRSDDIEFKPHSEGFISIWKKPRLEGKYLISADVALGVNDGAYSVGKVFDRSSWEVVAEWRGRIEPGAFGEELVKLGQFYHYALLLPENNNVGWATIERIKELRYRNLVKAQDIFPGYASDVEGFPTNEKTKNQIISALYNALEEGVYKENSYQTIYEMMRAVRDDSGKMKSEGTYLDCVMATAIGVFALKFLTVDGSYLKREESPMVVTSCTSLPSRPRQYSRRVA